MTAPSLQPPSVAVHASFLAAMAEFCDEGRGVRDDRSMIGVDLRAWVPTWTSAAEFARYVAALRSEAEEDTPRPDGYVPSTTLWWTAGREYLGRLAIRHRLTPALQRLGGHIGYDVRPTARRRGHASAMLRAALPIAARLGIDQALVTCNVTNLGSRRVIENNAGVLLDEQQGTLRYLVPTAATAQSVRQSVR
jgi:predicted acetyltransferase